MEKQKERLTFKKTEYFNTDGFDIVLYECLEDSSKNTWGLKAPVLTQSGLVNGIIPIKNATNLEHAFASAEFVLKTHLDTLDKKINEIKSKKSLVLGSSEDLNQINHLQEKQGKLIL